ncbi:hypothetical protein COEREDRAFT_93443 [Coemansia reversa NRRL 1564]|uniref:Uncharacterized protein n=1 Tax=Coemansia reversa (strain ATCC 12441 / NRRL 1564) TaxID=763665 RepID=A0A2G5B876_COERN|nr:hypothetical protein COEREDRAFT_93443 [Coemansia reversa NRRL 1564]|eukprot:PIA15243.1 hypothetical protein COEREDRAFT_93443 [Coemansia reversa NRRL 1564]
MSALFFFTMSALFFFTMPALFFLCAAFTLIFFTASALAFLFFKAPTLIVFLLFFLFLALTPRWRHRRLLLTPTPRWRHRCLLLRRCCLERTLRLTARTPYRLKLSFSLVCCRAPPTRSTRRS